MPEAVGSNLIGPAKEIKGLRSNDLKPFFFLWVQMMSVCVYQNKIQYDLNDFLCVKNILITLHLIICIFISPDFMNFIGKICKYYL